MGALGLPVSTSDDCELQEYTSQLHFPVPDPVSENHTGKRSGQHTSPSLPPQAGLPPLACLMATLPSPAARGLRCWAGSAPLITAVVSGTSSRWSCAQYVLGQ